MFGSVSAGRFVPSGRMGITDSPDATNRYASLRMSGMGVRSSCGVVTRCSHDRSGADELFACASCTTVYPHLRTEMTASLSIPCEQPTCRAQRLEIHRMINRAWPYDGPRHHSGMPFSEPTLPSTALHTSSGSRFALPLTGVVSAKRRRRAPAIR
jgi:hypothetical protein